MFQASIKTVALTLAASGLAISVPASAAPVTAWDVDAPAYGSLAYQHWRHDRGEKRGHNKRNRYESYSAYRTPDRSRPYYMNYPSNYGEPVYRDSRVWRGEDGRYYCRKSNGTTGLLIGAGVGALLGREVAGRGGDRTLGAILGAAGGALLGRSLDSGTRCG